MGLRRTAALVCVIFCIPSSGRAQELVYPVGDENIRPLTCGETNAGPTNDYCITQDFQFKIGLCHAAVDLAKDREPGGLVRAIAPGTN